MRHQKPHLILCGDSLDEVLHALPHAADRGVQAENSPLHGRDDHL